MGLGYSNPINPSLDTGGFLCMSIRTTDRFRLFHAPPEVVDMVMNVAKSVHQSRFN